MNEIIIKEPLFQKLSKEEYAYRTYYSRAVQYTTPLTFMEWKAAISEVRHTC